jgi:hypothetical protein
MLRRIAAWNLLAELWRAGNMKMSEFESLSHHEQLAILYQDGVYIGKRRTGELTRLLFQLEAFYIEISYRSYRKAIHKICCSHSTVILEPYLEQIEIEYLVT